MDFDDFMVYFKANSKQKLYFSDSFKADFIKSGLELFLFHTYHEELENIRDTEKLLKTVPLYEPPQNIKHIQSLIQGYNSMFPLIIFFTYEPR